jgi:DNA-binding protein YbaB
MNGHREIQSITLAPEVVDPEDVETLQDLIVAAIQDASKKATELSEKRMSALTGGMKVPGLF